uniref:Uncharacterized protein n=1 Tax=Romanomermis culicivorax TaxID=13658 RepID=A0A915IGL9_ROMCU
MQISCLEVPFVASGFRTVDHTSWVFCKISAILKKQTLRCPYMAKCRYLCVEAGMNVETATLHHISLGQGAPIKSSNKKTFAFVMIGRTTALILFYVENQ